MLDPAILHSLEARFPPEQPAIVEERVWQSVAGDQAERIGRRIADSFEAAANEWIAVMERGRERIGDVQIQINPETLAVDLAVFDRLVEDFEALADLRARRAAREERRHKRSVKASFASDPSVGAARRAFGQRIVAVEKRVIEALLDYALFLRAIRSEIDPRARGGPTFSSTADLQRHLAGLGAA